MRSTSADAADGPAPSMGNVMAAWLEERSAQGAGPAVWLGLFVGMLLLIPAGSPPPLAVAYLFVFGAALGVALRWPIGPVAVLLLLAAGIHLRSELFAAGYSDVLTVTRAAIDLVLSGGNPYGHGYAESVPPGAPFAYGPLSLLWYLPAADPRMVELLASYVILGVLALRGRPLGLAVYALAPTLISTASDGSNDTSGGLFILVALVVAMRAPTAGVVLLAVAAGFKPYAAAWLPPLLAWAGVPLLMPFLATSAVVWGPPLLLWSPGAIIESFRLADAVHGSPWFSLAYALGVVDRAQAGAFDRLRFVVGVGLAAVTWPFVRSRSAVIVAGLLIFLATLFTGFWSTFAYFSAVAPVLCWHLDDWLGLGAWRVRWPGDPAGAIEEAIDARWPSRRPGVLRTLRGRRPSEVPGDST